ncbi:hypothetical protein LQ764DRAFT_233173 [Zygosaccharomyces rouxii]|uniref:Uncharacterized protein KLLA0C03278g n=1 Tax=Zygosaccharomyces rouxii TaxID=4956 RepID=B2G4Q1_ZYGRO|nr:hypothetical protein LQ764DRAFT_233173 [Zygosaccharomyces rouxii]CAQ43560.1 Uncharacterised protein KLLA0C03278g [Zygosaccharomyces rouxii]
MSFLESTMLFTCNKDQNMSNGTTTTTTTTTAPAINNHRGMKRSGEQKELQQFCKKPKTLGFTHFILTIPHELLLLILSHLSRRDLIQISLASKTVRHILSPYLFSQVKVSWRDLISTWNQRNIPVNITNVQLIEKLRLTTCCSKNEWTFPFAELFKHNNLTSLELCTSGSTNFFKYSSGGSQLQVLEIHAVKPGSIFSMEHLVPFQKLRKLSLKDFEIDAFEEDEKSCPHLSTLELDNCTWRYPFQLESFGRDKIDSLTLKYTNHFVISERFKMFLNGPHFRKLRHLSISNWERNLKLTLSVHIMRLIESIPTLRTLQLGGNIYNETLNNFTNADWENCIKYVGVRDVKVFYSSFLN